MKPGDKVVCVSPGRNSLLTKNKIYTVEDIRNENEIGLDVGYYCVFRFKLVKNLNQVWNKPKGAI